MVFSYGCAGDDQQGNAIRKEQEERRSWLSGTCSYRK
jgi:hypothetical protein